MVVSSIWKVVVFLGRDIILLWLAHADDKELTIHFLQVLFQNDSPATLLARVIGITGPIDPAMLAKGRDTYKYFTKNHMLYERNQVEISTFL